MENNSGKSNVGKNNNLDNFDDPADYIDNYTIDYDPHEVVGGGSM